MCRTFSAHVIHRFTRLCRVIFILYEGRPASRILELFGFFFAALRRLTTNYLMEYRGATHFSLQYSLADESCILLFTSVVLQCCESGIFIPDPEFYPFRILDPGSNKNNKRRGNQKLLSFLLIKLS